MRASVNATNKLLDGIFPPATTFFISLHTGDTGTTGANEQTASTRGSSAFPAAANGSKSNGSATTVTTAGVTASSYAGTFDAATGTAFEVGAPLSSNVTAANVVFAVGSLVFSGS